MQIHIFLKSLLTHGIVCFIGSCFALVMYILHADELLSRFIVGMFCLMFFLLGVVNCRIHFDMKKKGTQLETYTGSVHDGMRSYVKIPEVYVFGLVTWGFFFMGAFFGGVGVILYLQTGEQTKLAFLVFTFFLWPPAIIAIVMYIKKIVIEKKRNIQYQKRRIMGIIGFICGCMVIVPIFLIGAVQILYGYIHAGSIISLLFGLVFGWLCIKIAPLAFHEEPELENEMESINEDINYLN